MSFAIECATRPRNIGTIDTLDGIGNLEHMELFFKLLIGHALADFVFQSDTMARAKDRHGELARSASANFPAWYYWLGAHALVHGGAVYLFTGSAILGLVEVVAHSAIDWAKCERWIGFDQDQALHVLCKVGYCFFV